MDPLLPVSLVVTLDPRRAAFFTEKCLPSIIANRPCEIIIETQPGGMCELRNRGREKATQPYLFFCDDDTVLLDDCLASLVQAIEPTGDCTAYAYGHYRIKKRGGTHPLHDGDVLRSRPYDVTALWNRNFVSSLSLFRAAAFPGWDEQLQSYVDWDIAMTLASRGCCGQFVDRVLFEAWYIDKGISACDYGADSRRYVRAKHGNVPYVLSE